MAKKSKPNKRGAGCGVGKEKEWIRGFVVRQMFYNFAAVTTKTTKNDEDANHTAAAATMGNRGRCGTL